MARPATYHLTPVEWWSRADPAEPLTAPSLAVEGFIHCTTGAEEMVATANRHYRDDPRDFVVLTLDLASVGSPWRVDDPTGIYPHVFGPIDRSAILAVRPMPRATDGTFLPFEEGSETGTRRLKPFARLRRARPRATAPVPESEHADPRVRRRR